MSFRPIIVTVFTDPALPPFERHGGPVRVGVSCPRGAVRRSEHRGLVDAQFEYARVVLLQYAAWMCANEHPVDPAPDPAAGLWLPAPDGRHGARAADGRGQAVPARAVHAGAQTADPETGWAGAGLSAAAVLVIVLLIS